MKIELIVLDKTGLQCYGGEFESKTEAFKYCRNLREKQFWRDLGQDPKGVDKIELRIDGEVNVDWFPKF